MKSWDAVGTHSPIQRLSVCEEFQAGEPGAERRRLRGSLRGARGPALAARGVSVQHGCAAVQLRVNEALTATDVVDPT